MYSTLGLFISIFQSTKYNRIVYNIMNIPSFLKNMSQLEMMVAILLVIYVVLPVEVPHMICGLVDGPVGMIVIFSTAVYLFLYSNPLLAVVFLFSGYEMLRRCSNITGKTVIMKYTPTQVKKDKKMKKMNPPKQCTLEEEVVQQMAPVGKSQHTKFMETEFSPVADNVGSASLYQ
jgi:hypothetical protein